MKLAKTISSPSPSCTPDHLKLIAFSSFQDQLFVRQTRDQLVPSLLQHFFQIILYFIKVLATGLLVANFFSGIYLHCMFFTALPQDQTIQMWFP